MKTRTMLIALPLALLATPAVAEKWVTVTTPNADGYSFEVDKDSIRRGSDGLVYFTDRLHGLASADAVDCSDEVTYVLSEDLANGEHHDYADWRTTGADLGEYPDTFAEDELKYVCANVR